MSDEAKQSHSRSEGSRCPTCGSTIKSVYRRPCDTENNAADPWHEAESLSAKNADSAVAPTPLIERIKNTGAACPYPNTKRRNQELATAFWCGVEQIKATIIEVLKSLPETSHPTEEEEVMPSEAGVSTANPQATGIRAVPGAAHPEEEERREFEKWA